MIINGEEEREEVEVWGVDVKFRFLEGKGCEDGE